MSVILTVASFVTATISGILGMGGGILLLAVMFCFSHEHLFIISLHGAVQLVSNSTRVYAFRKAVDWNTVARFVLGAAPGVVLAGVLLWLLGKPEESAPYLKILIGVYILVVTFLPKPKKDVHAGRAYDFTLLGLVAGTAALTVGATGPLIAPLFARREFESQRLVATKAMCQTFTHLAKLIVFPFVIAFEFRAFAELFVLMAIAAVAGTFLGKRIHSHVSQDTFNLLYRIALVIAGSKVLIVDGLRHVFW